MEPDREPPVVDDPDFPSGPWTGYWVEGGCRFRQDLALRFADRRMHGEGIDTVGRFRVDGRYDPESHEARWTKTYVGSHSVDYRGFREGRGIWGTWDCLGYKGGFHIWPREDKVDESAMTSEEIDLRKALEEILPGIVYG